MITCTLLKNTSQSLALVDGVQPGLRLQASIHFCRRKTSLGKVNNLLFPLPRQRNAHHTIVIQYYITNSKRNHQLANAVTKDAMFDRNCPIRLQAGVNRWLHLRTALAISCFQAPCIYRPRYRQVKIK
jgi:hypothetical protein